MRGGVESRFRKSQQMLAAIERFAPLGPDSHLFELGTGWMHWYALSLRVHHPGLRVSTFDVWDNRQFDALQARFRRFRDHYEAVEDPPQHVLDGFDVIDRVSSFDELYEAFTMSYLVDPDGSLHHFEDASMSHIVSADVLEHVDVQAAEGIVAELHRMLRPGGLSIHQIAIDDHVTHFDPTRSEKEYLRFSERRWRVLYQNRVQFFNRIQATEWLAMFESAGFECLDVQRLTCDVSDLDIAPQYRKLSPTDLECSRLSVVHRKPLA